MNRLTVGLLLGLIAGVPGGVAIHAQYMRNAAPASPEQGTVAAAKELAPQYLTQLFTHIDDPVVQGDTVTFNAVVLNQKCLLTMQRSPILSASNRSGWLVTSMPCDLVK